MNGVHLSISAWREIFERVFTGIPCQDNVSPEWLVNPATSRRLKLDKYYPDAGIAVRFVGLTAKGQGRQSDWEALETEQRDETREELCRQNGVRLLRLDPDDEDVVKQVDALLGALSHAKRPTTGHAGRLSSQRRTALLDQAYTTASELRSRLAKNPTQTFATLAEAWRDRELGYSAPPPPKPKHVTHQQIGSLQTGQQVHHERFGDGEVVTVDGAGDEQKVTLRFADGQQKTFLVALVQDKLTPLRKK